MRLRREAPSFEEACARAVTGSGDDAGHRLQWMSATGSGSCDLPAARDAFLVVGRHSSCDLVLGADPCIALRHAIVRSSVLDDGCPVVSVLDLQTRDGFQIADGTAQRSIVATGPLAFRIGAYTLVALPGGAPAEAAFNPPVCERADAHPYRAASRRLEDQPVHSWRVVSRITLMPGPSSVSLHPPNAPFREDTRHALTLFARGRRTGVVISGADLDRGVLVGRDPRCVDAGLHAILDGGISRMHLLLRRGARGTIVAFDLASTQGTYDRGGRRIRSVELDDAGTTLMMGTLQPIRLDWRRL